MKNIIKKFMTVLLSLTIAFSVATVPASAVNVYEENTFGGLVEIYDYGNEADKSFLEKVVDLFHWYIARIFVYFDADCPICGEHFEIPQLEHNIEYYYNDAINTLKAYKGSVVAEKKRMVDIAISDATAQAVKSVFESVAESLSGSTSTTYTFNGGVTEDGVKISDVIQPLGREACLAEDDTVSSVAHFSDYENEVESLTVALVEETSYYDGESVTEPEHNASIIEAVNPGVLELGPIAITQAELTYPVTVAGVDFDEEGRISALVIRIPVEADFTAKVAMINCTAGCRAEITEEYSFTYVN